MINKWAGWLVVATSILARMAMPFFISNYSYLPNLLPDSTMHRSFGQMMLLIIGAVFLDISMVGLNQFLKVSRKFEQRYQALFKRSNDAIFIINLDLELIETNLNGARLLGYSQEEMLNMKIENLVTRPEELAHCVDRLLAGDTVPIRENQFISKNSDLIDVQLSTSLVRDEKNAPLYFQCVARDLREEKRTKRRLVEYTQRYQAMFDSTVDAVFILGLDGKQIDANEQAAKIMGYESLEDFRGKSKDDLLAPGEDIHFQKVFEDLLAGKHVPKYDRKMIRKDGRTIIVEVSAGLVYDSDGTPLYVQTISRDITLKRMREERLETSLAEMEILAMTDHLTKLLNRRAIYEQAQIHNNEAKLNQDTFSVILIDVDLLKNINDQYGHQFGDLALKHLAAQLEIGKRKSDRTGRWGGDEFLIVMPRTGLKEAEIVARRLHELIGEKSLLVKSVEFQVGTSIGVAGTESANGGVYELETVLSMADKAMYLAKEAGRRGVAVFRQEKAGEK
jgi:diguanylate cyclase (GGDEF)-like protein/PAS domain S-box-containing protein